METPLSFDVVWWITVVEIPVITGLFWLVRHNRQDHENAMIRYNQRVDLAITQIRETLSAYKLEVAKNYASIEYLKDVEQRLTDHLVRIEAKLDRATNIEKGGE